MCGRYHQAAPAERLGREYDLDIRDNIPPRYNIAPTQPISVIHMNDDRRRVHSLMCWGFVPSWAKKDYLKKLATRPMINARSDGIGEKPTFRSAWKRRRCLIPATGYYEWKTEKGAKQPYCIQRADGELFSFGGIWETAIGPDGGEVDTTAIITTDAGADLDELHHREPAIIPYQDYQCWLETNERDASHLVAMLVARPRGFWRYFPVSKAVNTAQNEGPNLVEPRHDLFG